MNGTEATAMRSMVQSLCRTDRLVLILTYAEQLTPAEISLVLDLSEPEVLRRQSSLYDRAREVVRCGNGGESTVSVSALA